MHSYRELFRVPGLRLTYVIGLVARLPMPARALALTVYTAVGLSQGYGPAGLVVGLFTLGSALGAFLWGTLNDRYGLRLAMTVTSICETVFWLLVPQMTFPVLAATALFGGMTASVGGSCFRIALGVLVPVDQRRAAFSLEATMTELCALVGPPAWMLVNTSTSTPTALYGLALLTLLGSGGFALLINPPLGERSTVSAAGWLDRRLLSLLLANSAAIVVIIGVEVGTFGMLNEAGQARWAGVVIAAQAAFSGIGGLVYGTLRRGFPLPLLVGISAVAALPVGLAGHSPLALSLAVAPMYLCCAPALAATAHALNEVAPVSALGRVMAMMQVSNMAGAGAGAILVGFAMDAVTPAFGPVAVGLGGLLLLGISRLLLVSRRTAVTV
ncbi:MFS transporter [Pseudonocardiaceae bacterium YIM PH 21723]|nr:MFS transporter [Pseudonocardiaceae bacterium YIM PH 21723]